MSVPYRLLRYCSLPLWQNAQRALHSLEVDRVFGREVIVGSPPSAEYMLTKLGGELLPIIDEIEKIGSKLREPRQAA